MLLTVLGVVVLALGVVSFYHAHTILAVLHFQAHSNARAALGGSRAPTHPRVNEAVSAVSASRPNPSAKQRTGIGRGSTHSGSGGPQGSPALGSLLSQCLTSEFKSVPNPTSAGALSLKTHPGNGATGSADSAEGRQVFLLANRHIVMGFVENPGPASTAAGTKGSKAGDGSPMLEFFPEMYNLQFAPPTNVASDPDTESGSTSKPSTAVPFGTAAVAADLFVMIFNFASNEDHAVQKRRDAIEMEKLMRQQSAYGGSFRSKFTDDYGMWMVLDCLLTTTTQSILL